MKIEFEKRPLKPSSSASDISKTVAALALPQSFQFWKVYVEKVEATQALKSDLKRKIKKSEQDAIKSAIEIKARISIHKNNTPS